MISRALDYLDDALNPIVVKELREAVQSRLVVSGLMLFLFLQLFIFGFYISFRTNEGHAGDFQAGQYLFGVLQVLLLGACMLLVPTYTGFRLAAERSDTNVDLLFISTLRPRSILAGKFWSAVILTLLIFSTCAPFMTLTYLMRGIDIPTILLVLGIDFLTVLGGTQIALFLGTLSTNRPLKGLLGLLCLAALVFLFSTGVAFSFALIEGGVIQPGVEPWKVWGALATFAGSVLALIGLFFTWSVAILSPSSANRSLPVRLYHLGLWLVSAPVAGAWSYAEKVNFPVYVWMWGSVLLFCLQLAIAINERERWAPRVAKTIPRLGLARLLAFLFYSSAAGGVLFACLMVGLTLAVGKVWFSSFPSFTARTPTTTVFNLLTVLSLFAFNYGMTAVFLRRTLLRKYLRPVHTWLVCALLIGLCSLLPYLIYGLYTLTERTPSSAGYQFQWWMLANPLNVLWEVGDFGSVMGMTSTSEVLCWAFVVGWAVVCGLLALPWVLDQLSAFRPPRQALAPSRQGSAA